MFGKLKILLEQVNYEKDYFEAKHDSLQNETNILKDFLLKGGFKFSSKEEIDFYVGKIINQENFDLEIEEESTIKVKI